MLKKPYTIYLTISLLIIVIGFVFFQYNQAATSGFNENNKFVEIIPELPQDKKIMIDITSGSTFGQLMAEAGLKAGLSQEIYQIALSHYDLTKIRAGYQIELTYYQQSNILQSLLYKINNEEEIFIFRDIAVIEAELIIGDWQVDRRLIDYQIKITVAEGEVTNSLYQSALDQGIDERAIIELANAFQWTLDFSMDTREGDSFKFIYEARYLNEEYQMPGKILGAKYNNAGQEYYLFYFAEDEENKGYFDLEGNSVQKMFLKSPVAFKYISSGFTTGSRYIKAFNISTGHRAIDYAAPLGTPVRAVGDGSVTLAAYQGSYGNLISLRHNGTYSTNYAHLSRFAVKRGDKVKQGQIIGYVGSTGLSTGPHLHYEMVKNGIKINPLKEVLPPGEPIKEENLERFFQEIAHWQEILQ